MFYEAYDQGNPDEITSVQAAAESQKLRSEYVSELFKVKGNLNMRLVSLKPEVRDQAYTELGDLIMKHSALISRAEKKRLMRERLNFKNNPAEYNKRLRAAKHVSKDTDDNLIKMALKIVNESTLEKLNEYVKAEGGAGSAADVEEGAISDRIPRARADQLHTAWKKILIQFEKEGGNADDLMGGDAGNQEALLQRGESDQLEELKDKLFIQENEDPFDAFQAFRHYGYTINLTEADRSNFA